MSSTLEFRSVRWALSAGTGLLLAVLLAAMCFAGAARAAAPTFGVSTIATGLGPTWVEPIDVTGDGKLDLVVTNGGDDSISVLAGDGTGGFVALGSPILTGGNNPYALDVADFDGDGHLDVAVANRSPVPPETSPVVTILRGDGAGGFTLWRSIVVGNECIDIKAVDLDDDGDADLVVTTMQWDVLHLIYNRYDELGQFYRVDVLLPTNGSTVMGVGDLNGDGHVDVAVGHSYASNDEDILLNDGLGPQLVGGSDFPLPNLAVSSSLTVGPNPQGAAFADFNKDGLMDMCVTSRHPDQANIFLGVGAGAFTGPTSYAVSEYAKVPVAADLNLDGNMDIVVCNYGDEPTYLPPGGTTISILTGVGNGTFNAQSTVTVGARPHSVAVADFNGDGRPDLAVPNYASDTVSVLLNTTPFPVTDKTPPVTSSSTDAAWHKTAVDVTLTAVDLGTGATGVDYIRYRVYTGTPGPFQTYTTPFTISADGVHTVDYYAVDKAGNTELLQSAKVKIDKTLPVVTLTTPTNGAAYVQGSAVTCGWTSSDATTGIASKGEVATVDGAPIARGARIDTLSAGAHTFALDVTDAAGNKRTVTAGFTITAPVLPPPPVTVPDPTSVTPASLVSTVTWGGNATLSATLKDTKTNTALGAKSVRVESSATGLAGSWQLLTTVTSDPSQSALGVCSTVVQPKAPTYYRFSFAGDSAYAAAVSGTIVAQVAPALAKPQAPSTVKAGARFSVSGSLKPRFASGAKTVKVKVYRYKSGKWVYLKQYSATNANSGGYSKYLLKLRLSGKGKYRFSASTAATAAWAAASTARSKTLQVK